MRMKPKDAPTVPKRSLPHVPAYCTGMRSCLRCGKHRLLADMHIQRLLGRKAWVCKPPCKLEVR